MKKLTRKDSWPEILAKEIKKAKTLPFKFGKHDCCLFAANIVKALTGRDLASGMREYTTAAGSIRMIKRNGGTLTKMLDKVMKEHGCTRKAAAFCQRGDIVVAMIETIGGKKERAAGVCVGSMAAFASDGLVFLPMNQVIRGWHYE